MSVVRAARRRIRLGLNALHWRIVDHLGDPAAQIQKPVDPCN
jgi:hypothetical protein